MKKIVLAGLTLVIIYSCATTKTATSTSFSQTDVERGMKYYPDLTLAQLESGKTLYSQNCGSCHGLKDPKKFTPDHLKKIVPNMVGKVNKKSEVLSKENEETITKYLVTMSGK
jgi:mono/diheme cytochrome c family protein